jgi:hypothetical protein
MMNCVNAVPYNSLASVCNGGVVMSGGGSDNQRLFVSPSGLEIERGNTITIAALIAALAAGGLTGGVAVDNDKQNLGLDAANLTISNGTGVSLSALAIYLAPLLRGEKIQDAFGVDVGYLLPL